MKKNIDWNENKNPDLQTEFCFCSMETKLAKTDPEMWRRRIYEYECERRNKAKKKKLYHVLWIFIYLWVWWSRRSLSLFMVYDWVSLWCEVLLQICYCIGRTIPSFDGLALKWNCTLFVLTRRAHLLRTYSKTKENPSHHHRCRCNK